MGLQEAEGRKLPQGVRVSSHAQWGFQVELAEGRELALEVKGLRSTVSMEQGRQSLAGLG
jgi:hypothetical protein